MAVEFEPFDISEHLDSEEMIAGYLSAAAEDKDPNVLIGALLHAAKARGMMQVAEAAGLNRESLYKALKPGAHPRFETVRAVLRALGVKLAMSARASQARAALDDAARRRPVTMADSVKPVTERIRGQTEKAAKTAAHAKSAGKTRTGTRPRERVSGGGTRALGH